MSHRGRLCTHTNTHTHTDEQHTGLGRKSLVLGGQALTKGWREKTAWVPGEKPQELWRAEQTDTFLLFLAVWLFFSRKEAAQRISSHSCYNKQGRELTSLCWGSTCVFWRLAQGSPRRLICCGHTAAAAAGGALKKKPTTTWKWCYCCADIGLFCLMWNVSIVDHNAATERIKAKQGSCVCSLAGWKEDLEQERDLFTSEGSQRH